MGWLFLSAVGAAGQVTTLDEGTFRISLNGNPVGNEVFSIRQQGEGAASFIIASAEIRTEGAGGREEMVPGLRTMGPDMAVSDYQIKISGSVQEEITVRTNGPRLVSVTISGGGEREREFRATSQTVVLDQGVAHQYFFLANRLPSGAGTVPVVSPRAGRQFDLRVTLVGAESLTIGGTPVPSRHLRLEGGGGTRDVWVDADGRVLRVEDPEVGYVALRIEAP
jgi:hypothetical protein